MIRPTTELTARELQLLIELPPLSFSAWLKVTEQRLRSEDVDPREKLAVLLGSLAKESSTARVGSVRYALLTAKQSVLRRFISEVTTTAFSNETKLLSETSAPRE